MSAFRRSRLLEKAPTSHSASLQPSEDSEQRRTEETRTPKSQWEAHASGVPVRVSRPNSRHPIFRRLVAGRSLRNEVFGAAPKTTRQRRVLPGMSPSCRRSSVALTPQFGRAGFPACRFTGLSSPVLGLAVGKPPEPADKNVCPTLAAVCRHALRRARGTSSSKPASPAPPSFPSLWRLAPAAGVLTNRCAQ